VKADRPANMDSVTPSNEYCYSLQETLVLLSTCLSLFTELQYVEL